MLINQTIDLTNATHAFVTFWTKWEIERTWDFAQVVAVTSAGDVALCGRYSKPGIGPVQPFGEPLYDGRQPIWIEEKINLQDFLGQQIKLRFDMTSDNFTELDGIYIDDLEVHVITPTGLAEDLKKSVITLGQAFPNPACATVSIAYQVPFWAQQPSIIIADLLGREVAQQALTQTTGNALIDLQKFVPGVYTYYLQAGGERSAAKRLVVVK